MCRFTVTSGPPPQPSSPDLEHLLDDDDFCWFDAIAEIPDPADDQGETVANVYPADAAAARSSESSENGQSDTKASPSAGNSDTSSYDLLELFKQQVEQEPAIMMAGGMQSQYAFTPFSANPAEQNDVAAGYPDAGLSMSTYAGTMGAPSALPVNMMPPAAPPVIMPAAPSSYLPPAVTLAPAMPAPAPAAPVVRKPGGRVQKTLEEQEAAIERIKQKRRESAQRSRARKNDYMRHLEIENQSLKEEVQRLQNMVQSLQRQSCMQPPQLLGQMVV